MGTTWSHSYECICLDCRTCYTPLHETVEQRHKRITSELLQRIAEAQNEYELCCYDRTKLQKADSHYESARRLWENFNKNYTARGFTFSIVEKDHRE